MYRVSTEVFLLSVIIIMGALKTLFDGFSILFITYLILILTLHYIGIQSPIDWKISLREKRIEWFRNILHTSLVNNNYSPDLLHYPLPSSIGRSDPEVNLVLPDVPEAEKELINLEIRAAKIFVLMVFYPILYLIIHLIWPFDFFYVLSNAILFLIILKLIQDRMRTPYKLDRWNECVDLLSKHRLSLIFQPWQLDPEFYKFFTNYEIIELSRIPQIKQDFSSWEVTGLLLNTLKLSDPLINKILLDEFLFQVRDLPRLQETHTAKWTAFKSQFALISISAVFFVSLLSSIIVVFGQLKLILVKSGIEEILPVYVAPGSPFIAILLSVLMFTTFSRLFFEPRKRDILTSLLFLESIVVTFSVIWIFQIIIT